jgi:hypothetical protein
MKTLSHAERAEAEVYSGNGIPFLERGMRNGVYKLLLYQVHRCLQALAQLSDGLSPYYRKVSR